MSKPLKTFKVTVGVIVLAIFCPGLGTTAQAQPESNGSRAQGPAIPKNLKTPSELPTQSASGQAARVENLPQISPFQLGLGETSRQFLSASGSDRFQLSRDAREATTTWFIHPIGNDLVRLQRQVGKEWMALGISDRVPTGSTPPRFGGGRGGRPGLGGVPPRGPIPPTRPVGRPIPVGLFPIHGGIDLVWHLHPIASGGYLLESLAHPGMCLTFPTSGGLLLSPMSFDPRQIWYPQVPSFTIPVPQYETTNHQFVPNPPLPPVEVAFSNTNRDELLILLADRRNPNSPTKLRIPAGGTLDVSIDRDAGGTIVETISIIDALGGFAEQTYTTPVPPQVLYDASVYEIFLQSIAIDRTGTSPNPIEDVNFQPRSIGLFLLPPGDQLDSGIVIDAFRAAEEEGNPGGVRRLSERDLKGSDASKSKDPLKDLLNQFQKERASF